MAYPVSPLAPPAGFPDLPEVGGVRFGTAAAGVKYQNRTDVMLAVTDGPATVAGVLTTSKTCSPAVVDCRAKLGNTTAASVAILVNSGNANAFTGAKGVESVRQVCTATSTATQCPIENVFTASTGVIGEPLPHDRITAVIADVANAVASDQIEAAAHAIMTTDTYPKGSGRSLQIDGKTVTIAGIAKGSGMIAPDMATMLVYIFTDAAIEYSALQAMVTRLSDKTFNCITVDSDTSTSDTLLVVATGASGASAQGSSEFEVALHDVMLDLAHQVVRDGEGATKFVTINVSGAESEPDAKRVALSIANSPLIKTAVAGEDPNWGRVVMAVGKSGAAADRDRLSIRFGDVLVAKEGEVAAGYSEADAAAHMRGTDIAISVDLGLGSAEFTAWTCDLTAQYIAINADYRS